MSGAPKPNPETEARRIKALKELHVLDSPKTASLDKLVELASLICEVPIAAISLVDTDRQWFKASKGLPVSETSRDIAFCAHAIETDGPFIIPDATLDPRFADSVLVTKNPRIRFYAGFNLVLGKGLKMGTLCAIDTKPRELLPWQITALEILSVFATELILRDWQTKVNTQQEDLVHRQAQHLESAAKMSALGEMAAGIAHEINNPLASILARAGFLLEISGTSKCTPELINQTATAIETTGLRISRTVRALRAFARDGENDPLEAASVNGIFGDTLELCQERFKQARVQLKIISPDPNLKVFCRPIQISQVLLNLLNNAFDATCKLQERWVELGCMQVGDQCQLFVRNSGPSIPNEVREKIMQPFFTTKPAGHGTGLGLSISQRILQAHHSSLELDPVTELTRFHFNLPEANSSALQTNSGKAKI